MSRFDELVWDRLLTRVERAASQCDQDEDEQPEVEREYVEAADALRDYARSLAAPWASNDELAVVVEALKCRAITWEAYAALGEEHERAPGAEKAAILRCVMARMTSGTEGSLLRDTRLDYSDEAT